MAGLFIKASVVLHFYGRYIALQPMSSWTNLQYGGPSQKALTQILSPARARFNENSFALDKMVFPNEIGVLWKIHKVQGYAALQPPSIYRWPAGSPLPTPRESYDFLAGSEQLPPQESILTNGQNWGTCRYIWENATTDRSIRITEESLNDISLVFSEGKEAGLIRTDTSYPGWSAFWNGKNIPLVKTGPVFSKMIIPGGAGTLNLRYSPKYFHATVWIACADLILIVGLLLNPQVVSIRQKMLTNIN